MVTNLGKRSAAGALISTLAMAFPAIAADPGRWDGFYAGFGLGVGSGTSTVATSGTPASNGICNVGGFPTPLAPTAVDRAPGTFITDTGGFPSFPPDDLRTGLPNVGYAAPRELGLVPLGPLVDAAYNYVTFTGGSASTTLQLQPLGHGPDGPIGLAFSSDPTRCVVYAPNSSLASVGGATFNTSLPAGTIGIDFRNSTQVITGNRIEGFVEAGSPGTTGTMGTVSALGVVGSAHLGHNWEVGPVFVLGVEGDILGTGGMTGPGFSLLASARGRVGVSTDKGLFYLTAGLAIGTNLGSSSETLGGGVIGGGVEYAVSESVSARFEQRFYALGLSGPTPAFTAAVTTVGLSFPL